jgi:SPX domain protein involved in polyphosphate accumulation
VKYAILQHLPVFLQKAMGGETDSQLVNSVYLDNSQLELYHGRLDKTPGAIALRLRW